MQEQLRAEYGSFTGLYHLGPILVCERGAKLRKLNLEVAAKDAKYWWKTEKIPLRAKPLRKSIKKKQKKGSNFTKK